MKKIKALFYRLLSWTTYCEFAHGYWHRRLKVAKLFKWTISRKEKND